MPQRVACGPRRRHSSRVARATSQTPKRRPAGSLSTTARIVDDSREWPSFALYPYHVRGLLVRVSLIARVRLSSGHAMTRMQFPSIVRLGVLALGFFGSSLGAQAQSES